MLKFLKGVLIVVGIIIVVAAIILMVVSIVDVNAIYGVYNPKNGGGPASLPAGETPDDNPWLWIVLTGVAALVGGFAAGFGLGIPNRTFKNRLKDATAADAESAN